MLEGVRMDREHLAVEAIKRVGPGGHFLQDDHTLNHFRDIIADLEQTLGKL